MILKKKSCLSAMLFSALLTGCSTLGFAKPPELHDISVAKVFNVSPKDVNKLSAFGVNDSIELLAYSLALKSDETQVFGGARHKITNSEKTMGALMIKASDDACYAYLTDISTAEKGTKSVLGAVSILLSGAAGLSTPVRSANLLSGISAATQGLEEELDSVILGGLEADILVQAVRRGRARQRQALTDILISEEPTAGFNMFIAEFSTYHDSCGISYGRDVLRAAVSDAVENEKPMVGEVRSAPTGEQ